LSFPRKIIFNLFQKEIIEQRKKDLNIYLSELMKFEKELVTNDELKQIFLKFFTPEAERAKHEKYRRWKKNDFIFN